MVWLALIGLTVWLIVQQNSLSELRREIAQLRGRLAGSVKPPPVATGITPAMEAAARGAAGAAVPVTPSAPIVPKAIVPEPIVPEPIAARAVPVLEVTRFTPASPPPPPIP